MRLFCCSDCRKTMVRDPSNPCIQTPFQAKSLLETKNTAFAGKKIESVVSPSTCT